MDWCLSKDKIFTFDNLNWHNQVIVHKCRICLSEGESKAHLFVHCPVAREIWAKILIGLGMSSFFATFSPGWFGARVGGQ